MEGWIKIHRKLLDWEWYSDSNMTRLWIHLLLSANYEPREWRGIEIGTGQMVTTVAQLEKDTGLSSKQIRLCLERLRKTNEIDISTTNKFSIITICKYDSYQLFESLEGQTKGKQKANKGQTYKEDKNIKENDISKDISQKKEPPTLKDREKSFYESLIPFVSIYGKDMVRDFYNYWSQVNPNGTKMLWEMQKAFDLKKRLVTWSSRETKKPETGKTRMDIYEEAAQRLIRGEKI